jgi:hypothetical protein
VTLAQDPLKPQNDGKIKLPPTDGAMNKIAPKLQTDNGKDIEAFNTRADKRRQKKDDEKILARARKRMEKCISAESESRKAELEDIKFRAGEQWPADVQAQRNFDKRPCLTINKCPTFVHQVTNPIRENRPAIHVSPVGDKGDPEVAKMYEGLIRYYQRKSRADIAHDTGMEQAVTSGLGFWRVTTVYESATSFNQEPRTERVRNRFTIYLDPDRQEPDGADSKYGFVTEMIPREEFEAVYPDADPLPFDQAGSGEKMKNWIDGKTIRIAEYFEVSDEARTLVFLSNGHTGWKDELGEDALDGLAQGRISIEKTRESQEKKVSWYKITAKEILERGDWLGETIPIIPCIGDELDVEGKVQYAGVIRHAKDAQRMYNYWVTAETEMIALQPKAPWVMEEGQIEGHEAEWKQSNIRNYPVLTYKGTSVGGSPAPPPQRQQFSGPASGIIAAKEGAANDMMATTGVRFDSTPGERMYDESGRALRELRRNSDIGSYHFMDNLSRALKREGEIYIDILPKYLDTKRMLLILREDGQEEQVMADPHASQPYAEVRPQPTPEKPNPKTLKIFNPNYGKYGVTVTTGPNYATKRVEAAESMMEFARVMPNVASLIADLIAKNMDWEGSEEIAARLAKAIPAQFLTPNQKDVPPQIQALMQQMDMQIKQLGMERQKLIMMLTEKQSDRQLEAHAIDQGFKAKILQIEEKFSEALLKLQGANDKKQFETEKMVLQTFLSGVQESDPNFQVQRQTEELKGAHEQMMTQMRDLAASMKKPKRIRLKTGSNGERYAEADYGEPQPKAG